MKDYGSFPAGMVDDVARFLVGTADRRDVRDLYEDVFRIPTMFPLQRKNELQWMMNLARSVTPRVIVDVGTDKGGGLYHWAAGLHPGRIAACEIRGLPYSGAFAVAFPAIDFLWIERSSRDPEAVDGVRRWLGNDRIDVLFLDGDKGAFREDFDAYVGHVADGGLVFFHDIQDGGPGGAFAACSKHSRVGTVLTCIDTREVDGALAIAPADRDAYAQWLAHWAGRSCGVGCLRMKG